MSFAHAQQQPVAGGDGAEQRLQQRIDKAITDYEKVRDGDGRPAQCRRLLGWIGEIDHPRVTEYLKKELARDAGSVAGTYAIEALGKLPRPDLVDYLCRFVRRPDVHPSACIAAARMIVGFGDAATDRLIRYAFGPKRVRSPAVRQAIVTGLATSGSERAIAVVARELLRGDQAHRLFMLKASEPVQNNAAIDGGRIDCVKNGNLLVSATAWRMLATEGHPLATQLTIDVLERVFDVPDARSAAELVRGLVLVGDPDFYPAILRFGSVRGSDVRAALQASAGPAAEHPELMAFLVDEGLESESEAEREVAKLLLAEAPAEAVAPLVARMRKQLQRNRKRVLGQAAGLHNLLARDPTWVQDLAALAAESDLDSRMVGLSLLADMGSPLAVPQAQRYVSNRAWELRSLSYRYLAKCRDVTSIPFLIARYGKEEGRLAHELDTALFVHTGTRCWTRRDWLNWWNTVKEGFALPHPDSVKSGGTTTGGQTVSYYDIPLISARIAFLVDQSGSMNAKVGTDRNRTRLDVAKEQLRQAVEALPKTHRINMIPFETQVRETWSRLRRLTRANRREMLEAVRKLKGGGGTNTFGALMAAFDDPNVDTIYLLTDGVPTAGELTNVDDILDAVEDINRTRQVVIHCISIGLDSVLLKQLAAMTGGQYKFVR